MRTAIMGNSMVLAESWASTMRFAQDQMSMLLQIVLTTDEPGLF